ncbi:hypothetical protein [Nonomuraea sp. NPDC050786]|uniref:hypothetical protein n=1 Tax=Nonomuraea sp. NPDC050786 TaxID=3154840 RepID=UPI0033F83288
MDRRPRRGRQRAGAAVVFVEYDRSPEARKLIAAGVPASSVRYNGTLHDFMMLNPVRVTEATSAAMAEAIDVLKTALKAGEPR